MEPLDSMTQDLFDKQVGIELQNMVLYLNAAQEAARLGYPNIARMWAKGSTDEHEHAKAFALQAMDLGASKMHSWPLTVDFVPDTIEAIAEALATAEVKTGEAMSDMIRVCESSCPAAAVWVSDRMPEQTQGTKEASDFLLAVREATASNTLRILDRACEGA